MYCFCINNKFNIITFPKHGCTQIIKYISQYLNIFDSHEHSFKTNNCNKFNSIHACGSRFKSYNPNVPTYLVTRPIELKVLSYFKANHYYHKRIHENPSFVYFIDNLEVYYKNDIHHLGMIHQKLKGIKIDYLLDLKNLENNLNDLFIKYGINFKFNKEYIINSKSIMNDNTFLKKEDYSVINYNDLNFPVHNELFLNKEIVKKIKTFYKDDLQYYIS